MNEWKLWGKLENNTPFGNTDDIVTDEDRQAAQAMIDELTVPEELNERLLRAMAERRAENEAKKAARRTSVRKFSMRAAAVAALLAVVMVMPFGGYVATAAENIHMWLDDVFSLNMKKSDRDYSVEIVEARVSNDFLYVGISEYWTGKVGEKISDGNIYFEHAFSGEIYDSKGNRLTFTDEDMCGTSLGGSEFSSYFSDGDREDERDDDEISEPYAWDTMCYYRFYIPGLTELIDSHHKSYVCHFNIAAAAYENYWDSIIEKDTRTKWASASLDFKFFIKNIDSVVTSQTYAIDRSFVFDTLRVDLKSLITGQNESNFLVELTPMNEMADAIAYSVKERKEWWAETWSGDDCSKFDGCFEMTVALLDEDGHIDYDYDEYGGREMADNVECYDFSGYFYFTDVQKTYSVILSNPWATMNCTESDMYDAVNRLGEKAQFRIVSLRCNVIDYDDEWSIGEMNPCVYGELETQTAERPNGSSGQDIAFDVSTGALSVKTSLNFYNAEYRLEDILYNGRSVWKYGHVVDENGGYDVSEYTDDNIRLLSVGILECVGGKVYAPLWGDFRGDSGHSFGDCYYRYDDKWDVNGDDVHYEYLPPYYLRMRKDQSVTLAYVAYRVKENGQWIDHLDYNPDYVDIELIKEDRATRQRGAAFMNALEPFGIVR